MSAIRIATLLYFLSICLCAQSPVYVVLWFDTEDYIEPAADDAALRIANDLAGMGVRATFKVVGEKARTLESRGRGDVIRARRRWPRRRVAPPSPSTGQEHDQPRCPDCCCWI